MLLLLISVTNNCRLNKLFFLLFWFNLEGTVWINKCAISNNKIDGQHLCFVWFLKPRDHFFWSCICRFVTYFVSGICPSLCFNTLYCHVFLFFYSKDCYGSLKCVNQNKFWVHKNGELQINWYKSYTFLSEIFFLRQWACMTQLCALVSTPFL